MAVCDLTTILVPTPWWLSLWFWSWRWLFWTLWSGKSLWLFWSWRFWSDKNHDVFILTKMMMILIMMILIMMIMYQVFTPLHPWASRGYRMDPLILLPLWYTLCHCASGLKIIVGWWWWWLRGMMIIQILLPLWHTVCHCASGMMFWISWYMRSIFFGGNFLTFVLKIMFPGVPQRVKLADIRYWLSNIFVCIL